jgi:uncharacterized membrane protein
MSTDFHLDHMIKGPDTFSHTPDSLQAAQDLGGAIGVNLSIMQARDSIAAAGVKVASDDALNSVVSVLEKTGIQVG